MAVFGATVREDFGGTSMAAYLARMTDKMQRGAIRSMMTKSGTLLAKEVRNQIKQRDMPYSRGRNAAERRKARKEGTKPLRLTITSRAWSRPAKGLIGRVVGPGYRGGKHGHLVEHGHRITGKARLKFRGLSIRSLRRGKLRGKTTRLGRKRVSGSGTMTHAHHFQEAAENAVESQVLGVQKRALRAFIARQKG